jgi:hypothetical protein
MRSRCRERRTHRQIIFAANAAAELPGVCAVDRDGQRISGIGDLVDIAGWDECRDGSVEVDRLPADDQVRVGIAAGQRIGRLVLFAEEDADDTPADVVRSC